MGKIVGATLCTHIPRLMMSDTEQAIYMHGKKTTLGDGLTALYEQKIKTLSFDTFLVFSTHWYSLAYFVLDGRDHHTGLFTSDEVPHMIHDYPFSYRGDFPLASLIRDEAEKSGLRAEVAREQSLPYHYSTLVPMKFLNPNAQHLVPPKHLILPMSVLYTTSVKNELDFGKAIKRAIEKSDRRVVLVASGGLSHKFHPYDTILERASPELTNIPIGNMQLDMAIIDLLKKGRHRSVIGLADQFRKKASPEGRFAHYLRMVGALCGNDCELKAEQFGAYEAAVGTGQVNLWFDVPH